jgi:hypothetical protein
MVWIARDTWLVSALKVTFTSSDIVLFCLLFLQFLDRSQVRGHKVIVLVGYDANIGTFAY